MDTSNPAAPMIVHAFMPRDSEGSGARDTRDMAGMRATHGVDTILDGVVVPDRYVVRVLPAGGAAMDAFVLTTLAWGLLVFGNVYCGMARRALDLTVETVKKRTSPGVTRSMVHQPGVQQGIAEMVLELEGIGPHLDQVARHWSDGVDHGTDWVIRIVAARYHAVKSAWHVMDRAVDLAGGFGILRKGSFEQPFRDARPGRTRPANSTLTHKLCAMLTLGLSPDELRPPTGSSRSGTVPDPRDPEARCDLRWPVRTRASR